MLGVSPLPLGVTEGWRWARHLSPHPSGPTALGHGLGHRWGPGGLQEVGGSQAPSFIAGGAAACGQGGSGCPGCWKPCGGTAERNGSVPWEELLLAARWHAQRLILGQRGVYRLAQDTVLQAAGPRAWLSSPQSHKATRLFNVPLINSILPNSGHILGCTIAGGFTPSIGSDCGAPGGSLQAAPPPQPPVLPPQPPWHSHCPRELHTEPRE